MKGKKAKKPVQHRQPRGRGGVEIKVQNDGSQLFRARKRKANHPLALGTVRDTWDAANEDLPFLGWDQDGKPVDFRDIELPTANNQQPTTPLFQDFMLEVLNSERSDSLSYSSWQRDEGVYRHRVWGSDLGQTPIDEITRKQCAAFIKAQKKLKPQRDRHGKIQLFEQNEVGLADPARPAGGTGGPPVSIQGRPGHAPHKTWIHEGKPIRLIREARWAVEADRPPVPRYVETHERPATITLRGIGNVLSAYFEAAREEPYAYIETNPMHRLKYPVERKGVHKKKSLTATEASGLGANLLAFTSALHGSGERFAAMVNTAMETGMRRGELCGQLRENIRRVKEGPFIRVDNGRVRTPGGMEDSSPKTGRVREIPIAEETYGRIMALPARRDPDKGLIYAFSTESGRPVRPDNFSRDFRKFRLSIGMPNLKLHNLRNTYISLMLRAGVDINTIMAMVGHTTPKMILQVYAETHQDTQVAAVGRFMQLLADARKAGKEERSVTV